AGSRRQPRLRAGQRGRGRRARVSRSDHRSEARRTPPLGDRLQEPRGGGRGEPRAPPLPADRDAGRPPRGGRGGPAGARLLRLPRALSLLRHGAAGAPRGLPARRRDSGSGGVRALRRALSLRDLARSPPARGRLRADGRAAAPRGRNRPARRAPQARPRARGPALQPDPPQRAVRRRREPVVPLAHRDHPEAPQLGGLRARERLPHQSDAARGRRSRAARHPRLMRVAMFAPEVHPYAKTGGLADVLAALPPALTRLGVEVSVCLPAYRSTLRGRGPFPVSQLVHAPVSSRMEPAEILAVPDARVPTFLVRADRFFDRDGLYGADGQDYGVNAERFAFFCRAALEWLRHVSPAPDILHLHDWQAALIPAFLRTTGDLYPELAATRTVLTVHNLTYQGRFPSSEWHLLNLDPRHFVPDGLEFWGDISYLKAGLLFADAITTVSPRYAEEIQTPSFGAGLDGVLRLRAARLRGILNGVDDTVWNPATDPLIPARYDREDLVG